jgi:hypothetical protein
MLVPLSKESADTTAGEIRQRFDKADRGDAPAGLRPAARQNLCNVCVQPPAAQVAGAPGFLAWTHS